MQEMQDTQEKRSSGSLTMMALLISVFVVAGGASLGYGVAAGNRGELAHRNMERIKQEGAKLFAARQYDASTLKTMQATNEAKEAAKFQETQQTWTRAGCVLIAMSAIVVVFALVRKRGKRS